MNLDDSFKREQEILALQLDQLRSALTHGGEKGRVLERYVESLVRDALPQEFGVTTGFIAFPPEYEGAEPTLSSQLDIIIYDALSSGPLIRFPTCDVLPLEAVLAYVEVKAVLKGGEQDGSLFKCVEQAQAIRRHKTRYYWVATGAIEADIAHVEWLPVRSYVFAFDGPKTVSDLLRDASEKLGDDAELSGMYVNGRGFYMTKSNARPAVLTVAEDNALLAFRQALVHALSRFGRLQGVRVPIFDPESKRTAQLGVVSTPYLGHYAPSAVRKTLDGERDPHAWKIMVNR